MEETKPDTFVDLLDHESMFNLLEAESVHTATVYEGQPNISWMESRVLQIVELNPWLEGRLVKDKKGKVQVRVPGSIPKESKRFVVTEAVKFDETELDILKYCKSFAKHLVKKGNDCVNKDEPCFRVIIGVVSPIRFVVIVTVSHTLFDGYSYYALYNMLSATATPTAFNFERKIVLARESQAKITDTPAFFESVGTICNFVGHVLTHGKLQLTAAMVAPAWIEGEKRKFKESVTTAKVVDADDHRTATFVSTNDLISSAYFKECKCDVGMMAINFRGRFDGITIDLIGNYESVICYQKDDFEKPEYIRESILAQPFRRKFWQKPLAQGFFTRQRSRLSIVTNWSSFYKQITIPGGRHVMHFPMFSPDNTFIMGFGIIFKASETQTALMVVGQRGNTTVQDLVASGMCYKTIL